MPFLHLPVQSGSDRILAAMNRRHVVRDYLKTVDRLRAARPDIALSTDLIVGFPGETETDFAETLNLVRRVGFVQAFAFKYSVRPGTPAAALPSQVPEEEKSARLERLQVLLRDQQSRFNRSCVGSVLPVLFVGRGRRPGQLVGRSPFMQPVHVSAPADAMGSVVAVRIDTALANSLAGSALNVETAALNAETAAGVGEMGIPA